MINSFFKTVFMLFSLLGTLVNASELEANKSLKEQGISVSDVKIKTLHRRYKNDVKFEIEVIKPIKVMDINVPAGAQITYEGGFLSQIRLKGSLQVNHYSCFNMIEFQFGKICRCYSLTDGSSGRSNLKNADVVFNSDGEFSIVRSLAPWDYDGRSYDQGLFSLAKNQEVTPMLELASSVESFCNNMPYKSFKQAEQVLKDLKVELSSIRIKDAFSSSDVDENYTYYNGDQIEFKTLKPLKFKAQDYPIGTSIFLVDKKIRSVELPVGRTLKVDQKFECKENVEFYPNGNPCSCRLDRDSTVNGYKIEAPASLYFSANGFSHFFPTGTSNKLVAGYYVITKGKPQLHKDITEQFNCGD